MEDKPGRRAKSRARAFAMPRVQIMSRMPEDPIEHVVWLMLENRSFDHVVGSLQKSISDIDGVVSAAGPRQNLDPEGRVYLQQPRAGARIDPDPVHEMPNVLRQLADRNQGFVRDYAESHPRTTPAQRQEVMAYHDEGTLEAMHALAREFTVCDRWFASVPGPTWTNRLFALSGTSLGRVKMPTGLFDLNLHRYAQDTIFDRLSAATPKRSWRIYYGDFPLTLLFAHQRTLKAGRHYAHMGHFAEDVGEARADADGFPEFVFIEPSYLWPSANDDHPPHDVRRGQQLIAEVYRTLRANEALWSSTLLVVTYDEHGGFYDHVNPSLVVPPERSVPPDAHREEFDFDQLGPRVPAVLASPWVGRRVEHEVFDHTSVLRYLIDKWSLGELGKRTAAAASIAVALRTDALEREMPPGVVVPPAGRVRVAALPGPPPETLNDNQKAIVALSQVLEETTVRLPADKVRRSMRLMRGASEQLEVARDRAEQFLAERGARV